MTVKLIFSSRFVDLFRYFCFFNMEEEHALVDWVSLSVCLWSHQVLFVSNGLVKFESNGTAGWQVVAPLQGLRCLV